MLGCGRLGGTGGEGSADEVRSLPAFTEIEVTSGISLAVSPGPQLVRVQGDAAAVDSIRTEVVSGRLVLLTDAGLLEGEAEVLVSLPALGALLASGGSVARASGVAAADRFFVAASGGSVVTLAGQTLSAVAEVSGGSRLEAADLVAASARLVASGGSNIEMSVTRELAVDGSGGSVIRVFGAPLLLEQSLTGGAQLLFEGARAP